VGARLEASGSTGWICTDEWRFCKPLRARLPSHSTVDFLYAVALMVASARAGGLLILGTPKSARAPISKRNWRCERCGPSDIWYRPHSCTQKWCQLGHCWRGRASLLVYRLVK